MGVVAVKQIVSLGRRDDAAGRGQDRVAGSHVPLAGLREPRVEVDAALGDAAELERRAA